MPSLAAAPIVTAKPLPGLEKKAVLVPPDVVERLKRVGLDPKDPNLASKLKALATQHSSAYVRSHVVAVTPAVLKTSSGQPLHVKRSAIGALRSASALVTGGILNQVWDFNKKSYLLDAATPTLPTFTTPFGLNYAVVSERKIALSGAGSVSVAFPCGGLKFDTAASITSGDDPSSNPWGFGIKSWGDHYYYFVWPNDFVWSLPIGQTRGGHVTVTFDNLTASTDILFAPTQAAVTIDVTIDHTPTVTGVGSVSPWGSTGVAAKNATLQNAGTPRVGSGDWTVNVQGNDSVGDGVQVGPGWTVKSTTIKSALSAAAPDDVSPDNSWRGAKVTLQPQAGTLRTGVAWHYTGIDTLDYTVEWTLTGPLGRRPLLTMAKHDSCDN